MGQNSTRLVFFTIFVLTVYLMFFNFDLDKAVQYTIGQVEMVWRSFK